MNTTNIEWYKNLVYSYMRASSQIFHRLFDIYTHISTQLYTFICKGVSFISFVTCYHDTSCWNFIKAAIDLTNKKSTHFSSSALCETFQVEREPLMFIECKCLVTSSILLKILYHNPSPYDLMYSPNIDHNLHFPHKISFFYHASDIWRYVHIIKRMYTLLIQHFQMDKYYDISHSLKIDLKKNDIFKSFPFYWFRANMLLK